MSPPQDPTKDESSLDDTTTLSVVEEELDVDVQERTTGRVRVSTRTDSVERHAEATLASVEANVTRVEVGRELDTDEPLPRTRVEGNVTIVPVLEERLVVEKRLVLVEEIHVERRKTTETLSVPISLRRQRASIERVPDDPSSDQPLSDRLTDTES